MYIRLAAEITSHLFQALTSSLSLSLFLVDFLLLRRPRFRLYSLPLSPRPPSILNPFIPTKSTRARSWVEYRRFREILRKNLHNFRNCLLMSEMKEAAATEWSSESFRLFLYKFSFVLPFLSSSRFLDSSKLRTADDRAGRSVSSAFLYRCAKFPQCSKS